MNQRKEIKEHHPQLPHISSNVIPLKKMHMRKMENINPRIQMGIFLIFRFKFF